MTKRILSVLFYIAIIAFLIVVINFIILNIEWPLKNDLSPGELISSGYRYIVFGSQNLNGIALYDLESEKIIPFIISKDRRIRYVNPVVGKSGKGYCIKEENIFKSKMKKNEIITFDLNTLKKGTTKVIIKQEYANISISPDETKLAFIFASVENKTPLLGIFNTKTENIEKTLPVYKHFFTSPVRIVWKSNTEIIIWSKLKEGPPALEYDIVSGRSHMIDNFPLDYKNSLLLALDRKKESVYVQNLETGKKKVLVRNNATGHDFSLSSDGNYVLYGWLRGMGIETLTVTNIKSGEKYQIKLKKHPSTVLGLSIW